MYSIRRLLVLALSITCLQSFASPTFASSTDCSLSGGTICQVTFVNSGTSETFTVPAGVSSIYFDVRGAQGGNGKLSTSVTGNGGKGGVDTGTLTVSPGLLLIIRVGESGTTGNSVPGGFNGGGATSATGGFLPGSGGGASDIRLATDTLTSRIIVAGGGGGASGYCYTANAGDGGVGGGLIAGDGGAGYSHTGCWSSAYGTGGTQSSGGNQVGYTGDGNIAKGALGVGGRGTGHSDGGGGGGGGYYGGAGAGVGPGGGGSSFLETSTARAAYVSTGFMSQGLQSGNGFVQFTYANILPAAVTLTSSGTAIYRSVMTLTATTNASGRVTFFSNGKRIAGCISLTLIGSSPNYSATCSWKPSSHGSVNISAAVTPTSAHSKASSPTISLSPDLRVQIR